MTAGRVVGYCRVSTENQKEEGTIDIQRQALADYTAAQGYELAEVFSDDGVSGGLEHRPGLAAMLDYLETAGDLAAVVIFKLDRLARDLYIQEHLIKKFEEGGVKLISIKEPDLDSKDPMRKAFRQFMGIVSELEKSFITMRMSGGRLNKARKGGYAGGARATGYRVKDGELSIDEAQAGTVRTIFKMRRQKKSLRAIAQALNESGAPTSRGGRWYAGTVKYILSNRLYRGKMQYKEIETRRDDLCIV